MAFIPTPECCLAVFHMHAGTVQWANTVWFAKTGWTYSDMQQLAFQCDNVWGRDILGNLSEEAYYDQVTVYGQRTQDDWVEICNTSAGNGDESGELIPLNAALVVSFQTTARGKTGRGRLYLAGCGEDWWDGSVFDSVWAEAMRQAIISLKTQTLSAGWTMSVVSHYENHLPRAAGRALPVGGIHVRSLIPGTQRRRLDRP